MKSYYKFKLDGDDYVIFEGDTTKIIPIYCSNTIDYDWSIDIEERYTYSYISYAGHDMSKISKEEAMLEIL